jgi:hypothetical protein
MESPWTATITGGSSNVYRGAVENFNRGLPRPPPPSFCCTKSVFSRAQRTSGAVQSPSGCRVACSCSAVAAERIAARNADCWFSTAGMWCGRALAEQINMINPAELEGEEILARYDRLLRMAERESRAITALGRVMRITQRSRVRAEPVARRSRMPARAGSLRIGSRQQNRKRSPPRLVWFDVGHMT